MADFQYINMSGEIKHVLSARAFDINLQKSLGFFPCDEHGRPLSQAEQAQNQQIVSTEVKKNVVDVPSEKLTEVNNAKIEAIKNEKVEIINPLAEENNQEPEIKNASAAVTAKPVTAKAKPGPKPKTNKS